jgi:hypothetical protein
MPAARSQRGSPARGSVSLSPADADAGCNPVLMISMPLAENCAKVAIAAPAG